MPRLEKILKQELERERESQLRYKREYAIKYAHGEEPTEIDIKCGHLNNFWCRLPHGSNRNQVVEHGVIDKNIEEDKLKFIKSYSRDVIGFLNSRSHFLHTHSKKYRSQTWREHYEAIDEALKEVDLGLWERIVGLKNRQELEDLYVSNKETMVTFMYQAYVILRKRGYWRSELVG